MRRIPTAKINLYACVASAPDIDNPFAIGLRDLRKLLAVARSVEHWEKMLRHGSPEQLRAARHAMIDALDKLNRADWGKR